MYLGIFEVFATYVGIFYETIYLMLMHMPYCNSTTNLSGKTAIVTGANSGIGYETTKNLAKRNARVIMICRNEEKGKSAMNEIIKVTKNKNVVLKLADLSSMKSVRKVAQEIIEEEEKLHILINNAGLMAEKKFITEEGLEYTYAANHFGPFLLTNLLLDLLKKSAPSRIVNVSSMAQRMGTIEFDNLCCQKGFPFLSMTWYSNTKLANVVFTTELARRLENTGVTTNALHPGLIQTNFISRLHLISRIPNWFSKSLLMTPEEGAQTTIHCAVCENANGITGSYFENCRIANEKANPCVFDADLGKKFWEASEKLTGLV